jgi:gamma-glutamyltranspeptidase/glutathione hydrolase
MRSAQRRRDRRGRLAAHVWTAASACAELPRHDRGGQPPVSQGHILLEELAIAEGLDATSPVGSASSSTRWSIKKMAFADRDAYSGDPRVVPSGRPSLDPAFAARAAAGSRRRRAIAPCGLARDGHHLSRRCRSRRQCGLLIESVFSEFGSASVAPGTGILLNNRLVGFSLDPASPNVLAPGKRPIHTLTPSSP